MPDIDSGTGTIAGSSGLTPPAQPVSDPLAALMTQFEARINGMEAKLRGEFEGALQQAHERISDLTQQVVGSSSDEKESELSWLSSIGRAIYYKFMNDTQVNHVGEPPLTETDKAAILAHDDDKRRALAGLPPNK